MKSSRVLACLTALVVGGLAQLSYAQLPYRVTVSAESFYAGEDHSPFVRDERSTRGPAAGEPEVVGVSTDLTIGGTTATALAEGAFNLLGAYAHVVATRPDLNDTMGGAASAGWEDSLFFVQDGVRITSGSVRLSADIDGTISLNGEGAVASASLNLSAEFSHLSAGSSAKTITFTENGSYEETMQLFATGDWDLQRGLPVTLVLFLGGGNRTSDPSTTTVDFNSTARITSIVYLNPQGQPDPSVTVVSASGTVYGVPVPEPSCGALAVICLSCIAGRRFRRRS